MASFIVERAAFEPPLGEPGLPLKPGNSRDRRPDLPQLVLSVAVDGQGWPVAFNVLPGNTADVAALNQAITRFRARFRLRRAVVVADRGMFARNTLARACQRKPLDPARRRPELRG